MAKATILDRLAGAMKTLSKREGKALTPKQRVAAAQRWNSLADIGENRLDALGRLSSRTDRTGETAASNYADAMYTLEDLGLLRAEQRADNPFLSDGIYRYAEQSKFLDWCRYNKVEPNARSLKQFRWETYQELPYRQRQWIANKDIIKPYLSSETGFGYDDELFDEIEALPEFKEYLQDRHLQEFPTYKSIEEFPDDFDYMWRY